MHGYAYFQRYVCILYYAHNFETDQGDDKVSSHCVY